MKFDYQAYDRHGAKHNGAIDASSLEDAKKAQATKFNGRQATRDTRK